MEFEWDEDKNQQNIDKHGVDFADARRIFDGFTLDAIDERFHYGELREISIGLLDGVAVLTVTHTDRDGTCRIISSRPAIKPERKRYDEALRKSFNG